MHDLSRTLRAARRGPLFDASELTEVSLGRDVIEQLLPHRGSMLLLDEIVAIDPAGQLVARRRIAADDPVFEGHFPGDPVYPGVLQMEAIGQAGLCLRHFVESGSSVVRADAVPAPLRLIKVLEAQFVDALMPGDEVTICCELVEDNGYTFVTLGQMLRHGKPVSVAAFEAMLLEEDRDA